MTVFQLWRDGNDPDSLELFENVYEIPRDISRTTNSEVPSLEYWDHGEDDKGRETWTWQGYTITMHCVR